MAIQKINGSMTPLQAKVDTIYSGDENIDFVDEYEDAVGSLTEISAAPAEELDFVGTYADEVDTSAIEPAP